MEKTVCTNRKARHDYFIDETYEAGIVLEGAEVKSLRQGKASIKESFARIEDGEVWLYDMYVAPYESATAYAPEPRRKRKLLLNRHEIRRLTGKVKERGYTLIPLRVYFKNSRAKVELALARGKKKYDKRREEAEREARKRMEQAVRLRQKGQ